MKKAVVNTMMNMEMNMEMYMCGCMCASFAMPLYDELSEKRIQE